MTLSIVGRYQLATGGLTHFYAVAQDPNDSDSFYGIAIDGTLKLYKFTWPDTLTLIVDTGVATFTANYIYTQGIIDQDWQYGVGLIDATWHYAFAVVGGNSAPYPTTVKIVDVNLSDLSVTVYDASPCNNGVFMYCPLVSTYDGVGTYFTLGSNDLILKKRYGSATGTKTSAANTGKPWMMIDDQSWATFENEKWYRTIASGTPSAVLLDATGIYLPKSSYWDGSAAMDASSYGRTTPGKTLLWDDNWRYMLWQVTVGAESWLVAVRKNLASGAYTGAVLSTAHDMAQGQVDGAFDIWQTGTTGDPAAVRKVFFSAGGFRDRIYSSLAWPMAMDNSVEIDTGGSGNVNPLYIATNEEFAYVFHLGGTTYGACITKVQDTDLIAASATPSISLPGAVTLWKDKRVFFAGVTAYLRYLWWSQPYEPQALDVGWDGYNTTIFDDENITALINLEDSVYCGSKKGWMRLRGKSPDHWILDHTLGQEGPLNNKTVAVTPYGAIYPRQNGLWIFNGYTSRLFFEQGKELMSQPNWDQVSKMFSLWDGRYFRFFYPNGSATSNDRELIIDLIGGVDNARGTEADRAAAGGWADIPSGIIYLGDEDGNILTEGGGSTSRSFEITSKEYPAQNLLMAGQFAKLHYDLDAAGAVVTITPIYDGVEKSGITIPTNSTRTRSHILLPKGNAYRVGIKISATTDQAVKIYEPWVLE